MSRLPAQVKRIDHIQHSYKCQHCSDEAPADKIIKAPVPKAPLTNSLGSASLISNTIYHKYILKVPAYRQEKDLRRMGLPLNHKTVFNWQYQGLRVLPLQPLRTLEKRAAKAGCNSRR
ncbi:hypothetical protein LL072_02840 [Lactobacillus delbrueckii subsp. lactis DSM 20072]|nr:transposase [Lactobacillus delbrueckii subsp. lactis DSM 20072]OOV09517.1 hypothetical protein LL072_02840 [Lactobacillus delbrueckii subsp. lactis DSM 20072]